MSKKEGKILLLPGDGIGPEVSNASKILINGIEKYTSCKFEIDFHKRLHSRNINGLVVTHGVMSGLPD